MKAYTRGFQNFEKAVVELGLSQNYWKTKAMWKDWVELMDKRHLDPEDFAHYTVEEMKVVIASSQHPDFHSTPENF